MAAYWYPPSACAATTTVIVVQVATDTATVHGDCTCHRPREARGTDEPLPRRALERLRWLERREEYREFVGHPPASPVVVNHGPARARTEAHRRTHAWRTRALGKRPQLAASG